MDRLEFIGQTYRGFTSSIDDIINFFDHTMAVYEIVGDTTAANVHGITDSIGQTLKIQATFNSEEELNNLINFINNTLHNRKSIYGRNFLVNAHTEGCYIELSVHEEY